MDQFGYKLKVPDDLTLESLKACVENGYRFLVFRYDIGIGVTSFQRFSSAILVAPNERLEPYYRPYNLITMLIGWFCFPLGPVTAIKTIIFNANGGVDLTGDIMLNITEEKLASKNVSFEMME